MSETARSIDGIYTRFILRDFVGKVIPGYTTMYLFILPINGYKETTQAAISLSIFPLIALTGIAWIITIGSQALSDRLNIFKYFPGEFHASTEDVVRFLRIATADEKAQYERFVVLKEASGNEASALLYGLTFNGLVFFLKTDFSTPFEIQIISLDPQNIAIISCILFLISGLQLMHQDHVERQYKYVKMCMSIHEEADTPKLIIPSKK